MDKYQILIVLNVPFVIFGLIKSYMFFKTGVIQRGGLFLRILFWAIILFGLVFAEEIYEFLGTHRLTDSTPLSIADVVLVTGVNFCFLLCMRLYTKVDILEKRLSDLHEKLSILNSKE